MKGLCKSPIQTVIVAYARWFKLHLQRVDCFGGHETKGKENQSTRLDVDVGGTRKNAQSKRPRAQGGDRGRPR